ncbi:MAG: hypothetical protein PHO01_07575 [Desulfotomaculaceae bacterium]|nr:hypothetical protein [Desulfotomaculaceae bacterium]
MLLSGCPGSEQAQQKPVSGSGSKQEIKIAVSLADMERDGNQTIKKTMSGRQGQGGQSGSQQQGQQSQQAAGGQGNQQVNITWLDAKNDSARQERSLSSW